MAHFIPENAGEILEPTKGDGNLIKAIEGKGNIIAPENFFDLEPQTFDWIIMNPPFSPMTLGYQILYNCINMSDNIIALMPWLTIINSERRTKKIIDFGLKSITHLPRNIFPGSRVQTCILEIKKGYSGDIKFINYANLL
jgi:type I restriction-modification system DNA methylase subunit